MRRGPVPQRRYGTPFPDGVGSVKETSTLPARALNYAARAFPQRDYGTPFLEGVGGVKHQLYWRGRSIMRLGPSYSSGEGWRPRVLGRTLLVSTGARGWEGGVVGGGGGILGRGKGGTSGWGRRGRSFFLSLFLLMPQIRPCIKIRPCNY